MSLRISTEPMDSRQMALRVEVDPARVEQELRKAARKVAGQYRIPGFRPGKAPYSVIVQQIGLPALFNEFLEPLGEEVYRQALEESKIEPYAIASLDVDSLEPLTYKFVVPLEPAVDLGDYRSLRLEEPSAEVDEADVDARLKEYQEQYADWGEVDRPAQYGDMLTMDVKSVLLDESGAGDEATVVLDETDWDVTLDQENPLEPAGFDEQLLGMRPGEEKEFVLSWPADSRSIYAGKQARFNVHVKAIQANTVPELDDAFAQMVGPDFATLEDLKNNIRTTLQESRKSQAENEYLEKALDALVAQSKLEYPPVVVEDQLDVMVSEFERQLRQFGIESLDSYLQQVGQTREQYRDSLREQAELIARRNLVISELYRQEGIEVTDEDIDRRIDAMVGGSPAGSGIEGDTESDSEESVEENAGENEAIAGEISGEAVEASAETETAEVEAAEAENGEETRQESDSARALRDLMHSGAGRAILESQILHDKALDRLLMIVRGEELPEIPAPKAEPEAGEAAAGDETEAAEEAEAVEIGATGLAAGDPAAQGSAAAEQDEAENA